MSPTEIADRLRQLERGQSELFSATARLPVREGKAGVLTGRIIYAQVNEVSDVGAGDPSFSFDHAIKIVGAIPAGGAGTAQNQYAQSYENNEWVLLFYDPGAEQWLTERGGGTSGSQVVHFELTENKSYADVARLAKPVLADGTLDAAADPFVVVDIPAEGEDAGRFYGLAAGADGDSEAVAHAGYRGYGVRFVDDYDSSGKPGFLIVDMEGPADFILVELAEAVSSGEGHCNLVGSMDPAGGPDAARRPRLEGDSYDLTIYDDLDVAGSAVVGDRWWAKWERASEHYIFDKPVARPDTPAYGLLIATLPAATIPGSGTWEITPGTTSAAVVLLEWNAGKTKLVAQMSGESAVTKRGVWRGATPLRGSSTEPLGVVGRLIQFDAGSGAGESFWVDSEMDLRGVPAYDKSKDMSIGKDAADLPEWQEDGECES